MYLLATFVFTDVPIARALGITFVVTLVVAIPQLVLGASAVTSIRRSRNELRRSKEELDVEQRTRELSEEIAKRSLIEAAQRDSETLLRLITDELPVYIAYIDADQCYRFANKIHEIVFEKSRDQIVGLSVANLLAKEDYAIVSEHLAAALRGEHREFEGKLKGNLPPGRERTLSMRLVPHIGHDGTVLGCFTLADDITERSRVEEHLRHSMKMDAVGKLTGGVAHEFNNLLMTISGNLGMTADLASDQQRPFVERAQRAVDRGALLTQRLLAYSRKQPLLPSETDLNQLIGQTCDMLQQTLGEKFELIHSLTVEGMLWRVNIDPSQMENALLNLVVNARDAMPAGGKIKIEARNVCFEQDHKEPNFTISTGDYVAVTVSDAGSGMPQEVVERVFEPFYTTKEVGSGTGLGLSMVYGFTKQSGGYIGVVSESGAGTAVTIYLPGERVPAASANDFQVAV